jgi:N-acetyl-gamma-glutamyl-phosphate reductase
VEFARTIPAAVVNGTSYSGVELLRLLHRHPAFALVEVTARGEAGKPVAAVFPHLPDISLAFSERVERAEVVFAALPDHAAVEQVPDLLAVGRRVVDLSAGFRLHDAALYPRWYGYEHAAPDLLDRAVYGLPELARAALPGAQLVACPGCYPTAAALALAPALEHGLIVPDIIVDAKSGISGAGRSLALSTHYGEANEDTAPYGLAGHRHRPEIVQMLQPLCREPLRLTFIPHLVPMTRGILATCYAPLLPGVGPDEVAAAYAEAYAGEPFVRMVDRAPHTKWTLGSNLCLVHATVDAGAGRLIAISALDNLMKGAASQAVQCANLMYGLPETLGLPSEGVYP